MTSIKQKHVLAPSCHPQGLQFQHAKLHGLMYRTSSLARWISVPSI